MGRGRVGSSIAIRVRVIRAQVSGSSEEANSVSLGTYFPGRQLALGLELLTVLLLLRLINVHCYEVPKNNFAYLYHHS